MKVISAQSGEIKLCIADDIHMKCSHFIHSFLKTPMYDDETYLFQSKEILWITMIDP
jgi:hypothetical protein